MDPVSTRRHGFTLLELVISIALVLVLMLAITKIFSITSTTIGASQGIAAATRDARAAQTVFARDVGSMASDSPFIWIRYDVPISAFRNKEDEASDRDYQSSSTTAAATVSQMNAKLTIDVNGNGIEGEGDGVAQGETILRQSPFQTATFGVNARSHRLDRFSFCARDRFARQTGNSSTNTLVAAQTSSEAWITYGHDVLPANNGRFSLNGDPTTSLKTNPGVGTAQTNPQNFYSSQWVLGRVAMLMILPTNAPSSNPNNEYIALGGIRQEFIKRPASWTAAANTSMSPLSDGSVAYDSSTPGVPILDGSGSNILLQNSRYDLIGIDIANATVRLNKYITAYNAGTVTTGWWANMLSSRFEVNPFVIKPVNASTSSQQVPIFVPSCSQFIVEFAGDFISQNSDGTLVAGTPADQLKSDGNIDFNVVNGVRKVQWYGMPRSTRGTYDVAAGQGDVVPVSDFVNYLTGTYIGGNAASATYKTYGDLVGAFPFERFLNTRALSDSYASSVIPAAYNTAWGPGDQNRPKMYRITLAIDRPELAGRSADAPTFEYIVTAP